MVLNMPFQIIIQYYQYSFLDLESNQTLARFYHILVRIDDTVYIDIQTWTCKIYIRYYKIVFVATCDSCTF